MNNKTLFFHSIEIVSRDSKILKNNSHFFPFILILFCIYIHVEQYQPIYKNETTFQQILVEINYILTVYLPLQVQETCIKYICIDLRGQSDRKQKKITTTKEERAIKSCCCDAHKLFDRHDTMFSRHIVSKTKLFTCLLLHFIVVSCVPCSFPFYCTFYSCVQRKKPILLLSRVSFWLPSRHKQMYAKQIDRTITK